MLHTITLPQGSRPHNPPPLRLIDAAAADISTDAREVTTAVIIPPGILRTQRLSAGEKLAFGRVLALAAPANFEQVYVSQNDLADQLVIARSTARTWLEELVNHRLLERLGGEASAPSLYRFLPHSLRTQRGYALKVTR